MKKEEKTSSCKVYRQVASRPSETAWDFLMEMRKKTEAAPSTLISIMMEYCAANKDDFNKYMKDYIYLYGRSYRNTSIG